MTDTAPTKKPSILDRLREFMDSLGNEDEVAAEAEIEGDAAEEVEAAQQLDTDPDAAQVAEEAAVEDAEVDPAAEGTPGGDDEGAAADEDLRAKIVEQAAQIETYKNLLADAGIEPPDEVESEADQLVHGDDTLDDEETVAAYDEDYAKQEAALAALKKEF